MSICKFVGCDGKVVMRGYCDKHRKRIARRGTPILMEKIGKATAHALYDSWCRLRRYHEYDARWDDFWLFLEDVKERPKGHSLWKVNRSIPYGPDNFIWKLGSKKFTQNKTQIQNNNVKQREKHLRRKFGITLAQYDILLKEQGGVCKICKDIDHAYDNFQVDHCHTTGKIRGLLCHLCNKGLGHFKDSPQLLEKAIAYLKER